MGEKKSIFISSTYTDLIEERKEAIDAVDIQWYAIAMEKFPSSDRHAKNDCLEKVREADAVILIIGGRYGYIDPDEHISITEIEYNEALRLKIPIFAFFNQNSKKEEDSPLFDKFIERVKKDRKHTKFKSCSELRENIIRTICEYERENGEIGVLIKIVCNDTDFYEPYINPEERFNYLQPFVGRESSIDELNFFLNSPHRIGIIIGDGGLGKSKLLYEWSRIIKGKKNDILILFLREGIIPTENSFRQIPSSKQVIIIVEDAHKRTDYDYVLNNLFFSHSRLKIIFSTRRYGLPGIKVRVSNAHIHKSDIKEFNEVKPLNNSDLEILGHSLLSTDNYVFISQLLSHARGSPLIFSISCWLIQNKQIDIGTLYADEDFEYDVYQRFLDVISQNIANLFPDNLYQKIIQLIAILSPFDTSNNELLVHTSDYLHITTQELRNFFNILKNFGVIEITGFNVRIKPDVLADYILFKTCFGSDGTTTGYAESIFNSFFKVYPQNILQNITEVDQWASSKNYRYSIIDNIWLPISESIIEGNNLQRIQLLKDIAFISYYIPDRSIQLVNSCLRKPQDTISDGILGFGHLEYNHLKVTDELCEILYNISFKKEYLPIICERLWFIAKLDTREYIRSSPISIEKLKKIAKYESQKPLEYNKIILDLIKSWVESSEEERLQYHLVDILYEFLKKEGEDTNWKGFTFSYRPVFFHPQKVSDLRELSLHLFNQIIISNSLKIQLPAVEALIHSLNPLIIKPENKEKFQKILELWEIEDLRTLDLIKSIIKSTDNSLLAFEIYLKISWCAKGESEKSKNVRDILELISSKFDFSLIRCIQGRFEREFEDDYTKYHEKLDGYITNSIQELIKTKSPLDFLELLESQIRTHIEASIGINPNQFLSMLGTINPNYGSEIVRTILNQNKVFLYRYVGSIINGISGNNSDLAKKLCEEIIERDIYEVQLSLSHFFVWGQLCNTLSDNVYEIIQFFLKSENENLKINGIKSIARLKENYIEEGLNYIKDCQINDSFNLLQAICETSSDIHHNYPDLNISEILESILRKMDFVCSFGAGYMDYEINQVLEISSKIVPHSVIDMIIRRISIAEEKYQNRIYDYEVFPHNGLHIELEGIFSSPQYHDFLIHIRNLTIQYDQRSYGPIPEIFAWLSNNYSESALQVLLEWIQQDSEDKINAVTYLIKEAPTDFLINNHEFCSKLIEKSAVTSEECYKKSISSLLGVFRYQARTRTLGEPDPVIQKLYEDSQKIAALYPKGSNTEQFYSNLSKEAMKDIEMELLHDEHMLDTHS
ncbi:MAG: DUF4062 domain-containing protein [Methanomicrobiales archaeon]|nr:DUF4062 domain-containing protein [Methanomicrobiales archaeon]